MPSARFPLGQLCAALVLLAAGLAGCGTAAGAPGPAGPADPRLRALVAQPHLVFLQPSGGDPTQDVVTVAPLAQGTPVRVATALRCRRAYFAGGRGICLGRDSRGAGFLFDGSFEPGRTFVQAGLPSRARVSPDGRFAAATVFVTGEGYGVPGFSTETVIMNVASGDITELDDFTVTRDGQRPRTAGRNFWGITFSADANRFYATLGTGGHSYLVQGDLAARTARVLADGVECPSLSPDGTRIAYKQPVPGALRTWRLHVLDLHTGADTALAETRSVDDQVEWLDGSRVLYGLQDQGPPATLDVNLWTVPADGTGSPAVFLAHAASPAVVRT